MQLILCKNGLGEPSGGRTVEESQEGPPAASVSSSIRSHAPRRIRAWALYSAAVAWKEKYGERKKKRCGGFLLCESLASPCPPNFFIFVYFSHGKERKKNNKNKKPRLGKYKIV